MPAYILTTPPIAVGVGKLWADLFNAVGVGSPIEVTGLWIVPKEDVAVTAVVGVRLDLYTTSAIGTGGTAAIRDNAANTAPDPAGGCFNRTDPGSPPLRSQVTARTAPTGGATIARWLWPMSYFPEETNPAPYATPCINWIRRGRGDESGLIVPEGTGLLVKQGGVLSVGSASLIIAFYA